jgi:hypothetical protein
MKSSAIALVIGTLMIAVAVIPTAGANPPIGQGSQRNLSAQEADLLRSLDIDNAMDQLMTISSMGEKIAGAPEEWAAQEYVYKQMSELPLDAVVKETFPTTSWEHHGDSMRVVSPVTMDIKCAIYCYSYGITGNWFGEDYSFATPNGGKTLLAPIVYAGYGTAAEFAVLGDITGSIALVYRDDTITNWPNVMNEEAALHGALAIITFGYYDGLVHPDGIKQDVVGGSLPFFSISKNSAMSVIELMKTSEVMVELEGNADAVTEAVGSAVNVIGYMYGTVHPEEYVIFSGHIDCFWNGTSDDTSSVACVLEYARLFSEARAANKFVNERTLIFASVAGEEFGGPSETWFDWLIGSYEFVKAHPNIMKGLVVELNMDGVSFKKANGQYWLENTWEINGFVSQAIKDIGKTGQISFYNPIWSWTDAWSYGAKGGGSVAQAWWTTGYDSIYHTQIDDTNLADEEPMKNILDLYTVMGARADHALVMPFDFMQTIDWVASSLWSEQMTVPYESEWFEKANAGLGMLRDTVSKVNAYAALLEASYKAAKTDEQRAIIRTAADELNRAMIDARRVITPWTLGEGGTAASWDVFLRSDQHVHDLGYVDATIAALKRGESGIVNNALKALESVYTMGWGHLFSPETYATAMSWMVAEPWYWGSDFDQQQAYVDVYWIWAGLKDGILPAADAISALEDIKQTQLIPWLEEDLAKLEWAYSEAAEVLEAVV